jgi:hypothetical protein
VKQVTAVLLISITFLKVREIRKQDNDMKNGAVLTRIGTRNSRNSIFEPTRFCIGSNADTKMDRSSILLKLHFHPQDPPLSELQRAWKEELSMPVGGLPLA